MCRKGWAWHRHPNLPRVRSQPAFLGVTEPEAAGLEPFQRAQLVLLLLGEAPRLKLRRGSCCLSQGGDFSVLRKLLISRLSEGPRLPVPFTHREPQNPRIPFFPPAIQRGQRGDSYSGCRPQHPKRCRPLPGNPWGTPGAHPSRWRCCFVRGSGCRRLSKQPVS